MSQGHGHFDARARFIRANKKSLQPTNDLKKFWNKFDNKAI